MSKYIIKKEKKNNIIIKIKIKKKYIYNIEKKLQQEIPNTKFLKIFVCIYKIKTFSKKLIMPSLEYLLYKNDNNEMIFPFFKITSNQNDLKISIKKYSTFLLKNINNNNNVKITGYLTIDENLFCLLEVKNKSIENIKLNNIQNDHKLWWTTIHEINSGKLINYKIHETTKYIFNQNKFLYIFNKKNIYREQPLYICDSCENVLKILKNNFLTNSNFHPLNICIKNAKKKKIKKPVLIRCSVFSKKYITKSIKISNLFRILPISLHFIKFTSNNKFKIK